MPVNTNGLSPAMQTIGGNGAECSEAVSIARPGDTDASASQGEQLSAWVRSMGLGELLA